MEHSQKYNKNMSTTKELCDINNSTGLRNDDKYIQQRNVTSQKPLKYVTYATRKCNDNAGQQRNTCREGQWVNNGYVGQCNINTDSKLRVEQTMTNMNLPQQLPGLPFNAPFMGRGKENTTVGSKLTRPLYNYKNKSSDVLSGVTIDRFEKLRYNPQDTEHIIPSAFIRGGISTRSELKHKYYIKKSEQ